MFGFCCAKTTGPANPAIATASIKIRTMVEQIAFKAVHAAVPREINLIVSIGAPSSSGPRARFPVSERMKAMAVLTAACDSQQQDYREENGGGR